MRLIDADVLIDNMENHITTMSVCSTTIEARAKGEMKRTCIADAANAPTIDAIPVEWLIDRANDSKRAPLYRRYAQMLYDEWRKEQEAR